MKSRNVRVALMFSLVASILTSAFILPANADRAQSLHLAFVSGRGPADALAGQLITSAPFNPSAGKVQVEVLNNANNRVTNVPVTIALGLGSDPGGASSTFVPPSATTAQGVATFDSLSIGATNVAEFTAYTLVARSTSDPDIAGATSAGFDIWESGAACQGSTCSLNHPTAGDPIPDTYRVNNSTVGSFITASTFSATESNVDCDGYDEFTGFVVWHEYSGNGSVFVVIHTGRDEMKSVASNGQTSVELCVGLSQRWTAKQVAGEEPQPVQKDTDGVGGVDLYVGLAPRCPKKLPQNGAPCITRQYGDGNGGNYTEAWIPGGDPPRRT